MIVSEKKKKNDKVRFAGKIPRIIGCRYVVKLRGF